MENTKRPLAATELEVVRLVHQLGRATVTEICETLPPERNLGYKTVQTLLRRAEQKGFLTHHSEGRAHIFVPTASESEMLDTAIANFIKKQFRNDPFELAKRLIDGDHLSHGDMRRIRKRIKRKLESLAEASNEG